MLFAYCLLAGRQFIYFLPSSNVSLCCLQALQGLISTIYLAIQYTQELKGARIKFSWLQLLVITCHLNLVSQV